MSIFAKKSRASAAPRGLDAVLATLKNAQNASQISTAPVAQAALSLESISESQMSALDGALAGMKHTIEAIAQEQVSNGMLPMTNAQSQAAQVAGVLAGDIGAFLSAPVVHNVVATENMAVVQPFGLGDIFSKRIGFEAYDEKDNRNAVQYSIAYNMQSARQDEFGEAFFPTIVVTPDTMGYSVSVRLVQVFDDITRNVTGALDQFKKKNILRGVIDSTILKNDLTRIVPVFRSGQNEDKFVAVGTLPQKTINLEGENIITSALKPGVKFSLLGLSQTDTLIANGAMDMSDSIDPAIALQTVYMKVGADIVALNTLNVPLSTFAPAQQGLHRLMQLNFTTSALQINAATRNVDGSAFTAAGSGGALVAITTGNYSARIGVTVTGSVNLETADTSVYTMGLELISLTDSSGNNISITSGAGATLASAIAGGSIIGYDLQAYRSNMNRRQRGQLLDTSFFTQLYPVPLRSPISVARPVTTDGATDSSDLAALITATHVRTSNAAVGALISAANTLNEFVSAADAANVGPEVLGVGRFLVKASYFAETLNMETSIDSISSHKRALDIQAVLVSKIRDLAYRMYRDSGYKAAADALAGGQAKAPTVIIGTDPIISRYLMVDGDLRTLGSDFGVKVVSTLDSRMSGKIAISFGQDGDAAAGAPNALHFGNMAWKPEMTIVMPISRRGQVSKELTVQPSFLHVVNLPVLAFLTVTNIPNVVASKVAVWTDEQP